MKRLKFLITGLIYLTLFACAPKEDTVELVPEVANEIRLISSDGIYPGIGFRSVVLNGDYAYAAVRSWAADTTSGGIYVFSLTGLDGVSTKNIQEQRFVYAPHITESMVRSGNYLYVGGDTAFSVFDISDPAIPKLVKTINEPASFSLKVYGQTLYVVAAQTIKLYDISNASNPTYLSTITNAGFNVAIVNGYSYSGAGISNLLRIKDINTPTVTTANVSLPGIPFHIEVVQNYLVVAALANNSSSLLIYSLADPVNISLSVERKYDFYMRAFATDGQNIVVSSPNGGEILQITSQGTFSLISTITNGSSTTYDGFPYFAAIESNRALISGDNYALYYRF